MRLQEIMNRDVETVAPTDKAAFANELMWRKQIHHLVVMEGNQVVGLISDTDLGGENGREIPDGQRVADVMSQDVVIEGPTATVDRAINVFRERHISCLPVVDDEGKLVGIVTTTDIENLAKRGASNSPYQGIDAKGPYPPVKSDLRGV